GDDNRRLLVPPASPVARASRRQRQVSRCLARRARIASRCAPASDGTGPMNAAGAQGWPARWASETFMYLTTIGRRTGRRHRIEIWFVVHDGRLFLMAGGRDRADWVRNLQANEHVTVELGN